MLKSLRVKMKIKSIQKLYSSTYDKWKDEKDPDLRGILKCDLLDLANAYDVLAQGEPIRPVPGLSSQYSENYEYMGVTGLFFPVSDSKIPEMLSKIRKLREVRTRLGKDLRTLRIQRYLKAVRKEDAEVRALLAKQGADPAMDFRGDLLGMRSYIQEVFIDNKWRWKPRVDGPLIETYCPTPTKFSTEVEFRMSRGLDPLVTMLTEPGVRRK